MESLRLDGCTATPFGSYLKSLAVLRLISAQTDDTPRGYWSKDTFILESNLDRQALLTFFIDKYSPTPIVAPWNGGSGFYPKDNKEGIDAIAASADLRFAGYRGVIERCRSFPEVAQGKSDDEDARRSAILRRCRNELDNLAVDWLDAAIAISADGSRSFAPVLGTGGNEGRLDYTNNFMSRLSALLIGSKIKDVVRDLLSNALFGDPTASLQAGAAGQFDPGRAGGANQGPGVAHDAATNPWDLILTLEGAVAWASGLHRRQGTGYRAILCSPFTVRSKPIGYGSASKGDDARAEIWAPIWTRPVRYAELQLLLREGRASVEGRPATNSVEFAEAACSLGIDRGIDHFVRYSLLKRRGDSYVALPAGTFAAGYRSESDLVRELSRFLDDLDRKTKGIEDLRRQVDNTIYQALLSGGSDKILSMVAAVGRLLRHVMTRMGVRIGAPKLNASTWLPKCDFCNVHEARIAASIASIFTIDVGSIADNLVRSDGRFAWTGATVTDRLISVLKRRLQVATSLEARLNPLGSACPLRPGDTTLFIEGSVDDRLIEDLLFAFTALDWKGFQLPEYRSVEVLPVYGILKHLFLPAEVRTPHGETKRITADPRVVSLLESDRVAEAADIAVHRLRVAGFRPLRVTYEAGVDPRRLAAALLIPIKAGNSLSAGLFHEVEESRTV